MTTSPALIEDDSDRAAYRKVEAEARLVRYGGDCYAYCALAAGFVDLVIETNLKPHDVVALVPIIEGAGGVDHHLGWRAGREGRTHHRRRRSAPARGCVQDPARWRRPALSRISEKWMPVFG